MLQKIKDGDVQLSTEEIAILQSAHTAIRESAKIYPVGDAGHRGIILAGIAFLIWLSGARTFISSTDPDELAKAKDARAITVACAVIASIAALGDLTTWSVNSKRQRVMAQSEVHEKHELSPTQQAVLSGYSFW